MKEDIKHRSGMIAVLTACAVPLHLWALFLIVAAIPQWLLRLNQGQIIGSVGYSLALTLVETLVVFAVVMALLLILPKRLIEPAAIPLAAAFVLISLAFMVYILYIPFGDEMKLALGVVGYVVALVAAWFAIKRWPRLARIINSVIDRLIPLAFLYIVFDLLGLILVIVRNVTA